MSSPCTGPCTVVFVSFGNCIFPATILGQFYNEQQSTYVLSQPIVDVIFELDKLVSNFAIQNIAKYKVRILITSEFSPCLVHSVLMSYYPQLNRLCFLHYVDLAFVENCIAMTKVNQYLNKGVYFANCMCIGVCDSNVDVKSHLAMKHTKYRFLHMVRNCSLEEFTIQWKMMSDVVLLSLQSKELHKQFVIEASTQTVFATPGWITESYDGTIRSTTSLRKSPENTMTPPPLSTTGIC